MIQIPYIHCSNRSLYYHYSIHPKKSNIGLFHQLCLPQNIKGLHILQAHLAFMGTHKKYWCKWKNLQMVSKTDHKACKIPRWLQLTLLDKSAEYTDLRYWCDVDHMFGMFLTRVHLSLHIIYSLCSHHFYKLHQLNVL
jgi:hypothetical protein